MRSVQSGLRGVGSWVAVAALAAASWRTAGAAEPLRIAAAADLQPVLPSVLADFTKQTGIVADASYHSSATLEQQIENGASFDLFMAADTSFPQKVIAAGLAEQAQPVVYARGTLVLWTRNDSPLLAKPGSQLTMAALSDPALKTLAVANPEHAPYGRAAKAALTSLGLLGMLTPKLVTAENIAQTAQFVSTGNAELGLISLTSALTLQSQGQYVVVPMTAYPPILQGAITLKHSAELPEAHKLLDYLATPAVRQALAARGLASPQ